MATEGVENTKDVDVVDQRIAMNNRVNRIKIANVVIGAFLIVQGLFGVLGALEISNKAVIVFTFKVY